LPHSRETEESDLTLIAQAIRRRIWIVAICFGLAVLGTLALTLQAEKRYEGTAALLVRTSTAVEPQRAVDTNLQLLSLPVIAERTAKRVPGTSKDEIEAEVESEQQSESDIIEVRATDSSPERAALIANAFAREFLEFRRVTTRGQIETGKIQLVESASPSSSPVSPKPVRNLIFGGLIGLVLGLGVALLLEQLDRRVKREDDLAEATGLPLLAAVPRRDAFDDDHLGRASLSPGETEVFRLLRANLRYFKVKQDVKSVVVTSAEPGEGKTLVSLGLALAAVTSGEKVLLLEGDLRDPGLSRVLRLPQSGGLSAVLSESDQVDPSSAVVPVAAGDLADAVGDATLDVLPAGAIPPNPTQLVESQRMREVLARAEEIYDFVVIDTPPVLVVSDAIPLIAAASGVLAVSGLGVSTLGSVTSLTDQLERLGAQTLGLVANFAKSDGRAYEGYGYGRPPTLTDGPEPQPSAETKPQ
jgi:capsular exopolysaccharide synthesis family protein